MEYTVNHIKDEITLTIKSPELYDLLDLANAYMTLYGYDTMPQRKKDIVNLLIKIDEDLNNISLEDY